MRSELALVPQPDTTKKRFEPAKIRDRLLALGAGGFSDESIRQLWVDSKWKTLLEIIVDRSIEKDIEARIVTIQSHAMLRTTPVELLVTLFAEKLPILREKRQLGIATATTALTLAIQALDEKRMFIVLRLLDIATDLLDRELPGSNRNELYVPLLDFYSELLANESERPQVQTQQFVWAIDSQQSHLEEKRAKAVQPNSETQAFVPIKPVESAQEKPIFHHNDFFAEGELEYLDYRKQYFKQANDPLKIAGVVLGLVLVAALAFYFMTRGDDLFHSSPLIDPAPAVKSPKTEAAEEVAKPPELPPPPPKVEPEKPIAAVELPPPETKPTIAAVPPIVAPPVQVVKSPILDGQIASLIWLRATPSPKGKALEHLSAGTKIRVLNRQEEWAEITTGKAQGFVPRFSIKGEKLPKRRREVKKPNPAARVPHRNRRWKLFNFTI